MWYNNNNNWCPYFIEEELDYGVEKEIGIFIMICGISFGLWVSSAQVIFCIDMWHNEYKTQAFETFLDYFFSVSKGAAVISVASALVSTFIGIILFHSKKGN